MIIKFFGKKRGNKTGADDVIQGVDGQSESEQLQVEFINLIEPLTSIIQRQQDYGSKLTALSIMAIVNMCNYSDDIKDIFLIKNGQNILTDLLGTKDEDVLLNCLRLIMTLITQKKQE